MTMPVRERSWFRLAALAAITGSRTTLGPALALRASARRRLARKAVYLMAAGELIGDKLPWTPSRTAPLGLGLRIASAAGVALALRPRRSSTATCAALALGIAGAFAGAFGGLRLRLALTRRLGGGPWANAVAGALEDVALIAFGTRFVRG
ncbi:MAG TPA: hypothetical protein VKQ32_15210 [Polyangia bacterium]|nr:hypothetical protein [Polyangia bacterium]